MRLKPSRTVLSATTTLSYFDSSKTTIVSADSSSYAIRGVLLQQTGQQMRFEFAEMSAKDSGIGVVAEFPEIYPHTLKIVVFVKSIDGRITANLGGQLKFPVDYGCRLADIFELHGNSYLVIVDYYSRCREYVKLKDPSSSSVIDNLKFVFSIHGISSVLKSDGAMQINSMLFKQLAKE